MLTKATYTYRFLTGLLAGLSLLLLPLVACMCEDHAEAPGEETAFHSHTNHAEHGSPAADFELSQDHECTCSALSLRAIAKAEGVKLKKLNLTLSCLPAAQASQAILIFAIISRPTEQASLRDRFLASTPSRGPPLT